MKAMVLLLVACVATLGLAVDSAEARRMGGGMSLGQQRPAPPPMAAGRSAQSPPAANTRPARGGSSRWLGPLAGLAAGGLLATLFLGDGFQGLAALDLALLILGAVGLVLLSRSRRSSGVIRASSRSGLVTAGGDSTEGAATSRPPPPPPPPPPRSPAAVYRERPEWFKEGRFLAEARRHFLALQAAWDRGDLETIQDFVTPELLGELSQQRRSLGEAPQFTDVTAVYVELVDLVREDGRVVVSLLFSGHVRESTDAPESPFAEVWHVQRPDRPGDEPWRVAGIQQPE